jgi:hypothetical protein
VRGVKALVASLGADIPVTPVLCFVGADWPLLFAPNSFRGVRLEDPKSLCRLVASRHTLDSTAINNLARILAAEFPAK